MFLLCKNSPQQQSLNLLIQPQAPPCFLQSCSAALSTLESFRFYFQTPGLTLSSATIFTWQEPTSSQVLLPPARSGFPSLNSHDTKSLLLHSTSYHTLQLLTTALTPAPDPWRSQHCAPHGHSHSLMLHQFHGSPKISFL